MQNLIIKGIVSATSNKVDDKYTQEVPTKTAYIEVPDAKIKQAMTNFGMREYTSKDGETSFFIVKLPKQVTLVKGNKMRKISGEVDTPNFKTLDGEEFGINIIKGHNKGNDFFRLQAIQVNEYTDVEDILMENPFGNGNLQVDEEQLPSYISDEDIPFD